VPKPSGTFLRAAVAALAVAAACALAACGSGAGQPAVAAAATLLQSPAGCATAVAYDVTDTGTVAWSARLPGTPQYSIPQPATLDGLAVFANGNVLSARRLAGGQQVWQRTYSKAAGSSTRPPGGPSAAGTGSSAGDVAGLWAWHGELIVVVAPFGLTGQDLDMRVQAVSPATGAVRWTADLGPGDLYNQMEITANGVLALITERGGSDGEGKLLAVGLNAGRLLWSRSYGEEEETDGPDAVGPVIVMASGGTVTGFDAHTGAVLWSHSRLPGGVGSVAGPGGSVLLYDILQQTDPPQAPPAASKLFPVTALNAVTGAVLWRAKTAGAVSQLSAADGLIVVGTSQPYRLTVLSPGGHVAWSVTDYAPNPMSWLETGTDLVSVSSEPDVRAPGIEAGLTMVTDRRLSTGAVRWSIRLADFGAEDAVVRPSGRNLVVTAQPLQGESSGALAVDPATGAVRARVLVGSAQLSAPVTAGGDTLIQAGPACIVPGGANAAVPAAGGSATASSHP
jgi:outer membrane protein assembly factor BamB